MPTQKERRKKMTQSTIWLIAARSRYLKDLCHYYDLRQVGINYVPSFELSVLWFQCSFEKNKLNCRPFAMIARIIQCRSCVWLVRFICLIFVSTFPMKIKNIYILNVQTAKTVFLLVAEIRSENSSWLASFYFLVIHPIVLFFLSVNCPLGYFFNSTGCQACAVDHYQDQEAQTECVTCPSGTSTFGQTGSKGSKDCQGQSNWIVRLLTSWLVGLCICWAAWLV